MQHADSTDAGPLIFTGWAQLHVCVHSSRKLHQNIQQSQEWLLEETGYKMCKFHKACYGYNNACAPTLHPCFLFHIDESVYNSILHEVAMLRSNVVPLTSPLNRLWSTNRQQLLCKTHRQRIQSGNVGRKCGVWTVSLKICDQTTL